jgi:glucose/arabinose dehydrogenase
MSTTAPVSVLLGLLALTLTAAPAAAQTPLTTEVVIGGLDQPVLVTHAPGDHERLFVLEKNTGHVEIIKAGVKNATPFLDLGPSGSNEVSTGSEQGLLGLAFHPNYQNNGWFFVNFTNAGGTTVVRRYTRQTADLANAGSGVNVMTISQPQSNHNAGMMAFSPVDGYLYIATGDGGSGGDQGTGHAAGGNAQSLDTRLGKILRIDVNALPHTIPPDNPFALGGFPREEIWSYGLRNPWRFSFDRKNGDIYIGDVGQGSREEIDWEAAGGPGGTNYGWNCMEGIDCTGYAGAGCVCGTAVTLPLHDYPWGFTPNEGRSAIGGYVYRGEAIPDLKGSYFFADHATAQIWSLRNAAGAISGLTNRTSELDPPGVTAINSPCSFGEDADGELYIVDRGGGTEIFRIVADGPFLGLGCATEGTHGEPRLHGEGTLVAGSTGALRLTNAKENSPNGLLFFGQVEGAAPFYLGTLKPVPWIGEPVFITTNAAGEWTIPWAAWPAGLPSGFELFFQYALEDPGNPTGVALSNALKATAP